MSPAVLLDRSQRLGLREVRSRLDAAMAGGVRRDGADSLGFSRYLRSRCARGRRNVRTTWTCHLRAWAWSAAAPSPAPRLASWRQHSDCHRMARCPTTWREGVEPRTRPHYITRLEAASG